MDHHRAPTPTPTPTHPHTRTPHPQTHTHIHAQKSGAVHCGWGHAERHPRGAVDAPGPSTRVIIQLSSIGTHSVASQAERVGGSACPPRSFCLVAYIGINNNKPSRGCVLQKRPPSISHHKKQSPKATGFFGCIGKDDFGKQLQVHTYMYIRICIYICLYMYRCMYVYVLLHRVDRSMYPRAFQIDRIALMYDYT